MAFHQQLQQRLASCSQASTSYAGAAAKRRATTTAAAAGVVAPSRCHHHHHHTNSSSSSSSRPTHRQLLCRPVVAAASADDSAGDATTADNNADDLQPLPQLLDPRNDSVYDSMTFASNRTPDYEDPQWVEKVQDWEDFWYNTEDDEALEVEQEGLSTAERSTTNLARAQLLVSQLNNLSERADVAHMITGDVRPFPYWEDTFKTEEEMIEEQMQFYAPDPNPDYDAVDLRALAEKRAARAALDAEWKAREALLAKPFSYTLSQQLGSDARLTSAEFDWIREEWTHEQIMDMIVGGGKYVHPDKVPARILNPLLPMDFHNDVRVHVVPETEEFIASIGHMASEEDIAYLQSGREVQLYSKDFVDPGLVFQATDGTQYVEAPPNPWAESMKAEEARDLVLFDALVEKVASRQRKREAAAAARAAGISPEEAAAAAAEAEDAAASGFYNADDEVMGAGFSAFVARDEDSEAGVLYYEDELDGDIPEADLIDRDEAEEEDGEGQ